MYKRIRIVQRGIRRTWMWRKAVMLASVNDRGHRAAPPLGCRTCFEIFRCNRNKAKILASSPLAKRQTNLDKPLY
jgi:hypothetical protein